MRHLLDWLHGNIGFLELNTRTLWSLIRIRSEMITDPPVAQEMAAKVERLLDENRYRRPREESWTRSATRSRSRADTDMGHFW